MIVKGSVALTAGIRGEFIKGFMAAPSRVPQFATIIPSNKKTETYAWLGEVAAMREWLGEREIKGFTDASFSITNKKWEGTLGIERDDISDDQTGGIMVRARDMGARARQHPDDLLWSQVIANPTGYDGVALFHTAHPIRGNQTATQSNKLTGTGTTVSALTTDLAAAKAAALNFKDERGKPFWPALQPEGMIVVCPPALEANFRTVLNAAVISQTSNIWQGQASLFVNPWLTDTNDWYLFYVGGVIKPLIFQDREPLTLDDQGVDSDTGFMKDVYLFGARARYNVGAGLWQAAVQTTN